MTRIVIKGRAVESVLLVMSALLLLFVGVASAQDIYLGEPDENESVETPEVPGREVVEPFFAFLVSLAEGDSLGTWTGQDILIQVQQEGFGPSKFPIELVKQVTRRRPLPDEQMTWPTSAVRAVWQVELTEKLKRSMPYSIMGYHPGSLRTARQLVLTEVRAGTVALPTKDTVVLVTDVILMRLDQGHLILDVDGLVDRLLGKTLDDSGTVGFVLAREQGRLLGLAVSLGRKGRRIYGEFDFQKDKVLPNGRPLAQSLSAASRRRMLDQYQGPPLGAWVDD